MRPVDVDIDDVLEDVARVLYERETGRSQTYRSEVREQSEITYMLPGAWQNIADSLLALDQSLAPVELPPPPSEVPLPGKVNSVFKGLLKRIIQKSVYWYVNPVVAQLHRMHGATDRVLHEIADQLRGINDRLEQLEKENVVSRVASLEGERFDERIGRLERSWRSREAQGTAPVSEPGQAPAEPLKIGADKDERATAERLRLEQPFHFDYYWFESIHRGDRALIKMRQQPYIEYFKGCSNVVDIGCGRGEFLELLQEKGIGGYGVDIEADASQFCSDAGLRVEQADALEHLAGLEDASIDGAFISQVAEHMTPAELITMVGLLYQKMEPGGYAVIETPNPQCLLIFASFFYADLSHVQPIHPETMRFLLLSAGFRDVEIKFINPVPKNQRLARVSEPQGSADAGWATEMNNNFEKLNSVLFGYMDYVAAARK